jgi:hypothetical protein
LIGCSYWQSIIDGCYWVCVYKCLVFITFFHGFNWQQLYEVAVLYLWVPDSLLKAYGFGMSLAVVFQMFWWKVYRFRISHVKSMILLRLVYGLPGVFCKKNGQFCCAFLLKNLRLPRFMV